MEEKVKVFKALLIAGVVVTAWYYSRWTYDYPFDTYSIVMGLEERPYAYRSLVPSLARLFSLILSNELSLRLVILLFAIGLFYATKNFICIFITDEIKALSFSFIIVESFMALFVLQAKVYDIASAFFFTLMLYLLVCNKFNFYFLLFPLACINKETAILLIFIYIVYFYKWYKSGFWNKFDYWNAIVYQVAAYSLIRILLTITYMDNPGVQFIVRPIDNILLFMDYPMVNFIHWASIIIILMLCLRDWEKKPKILKVAFKVSAPILFILYIICGYSFEIRIFSDIYPIIFILSSWRLIT